MRPPDHEVRIRPQPGDVVDTSHRQIPWPPSSRQRLDLRAQRAAVALADQVGEPVLNTDTHRVPHLRCSGPARCAVCRFVPRSAGVSASPEWQFPARSPEPTARRGLAGARRMQGGDADPVVGRAADPQRAPRPRQRTGRSVQSPDGVLRQRPTPARDGGAERFTPQPGRPLQVGTDQARQLGVVAEPGRRSPIRADPPRPGAPTRHPRPGTSTPISPRNRSPPPPGVGPRPGRRTRCLPATAEHRRPREHQRDDRHRGLLDRAQIDRGHRLDAR